MKKIIFIVIYALLILIIIPSIITRLYTKRNTQEEENQPQGLGLEQYIVGVVAAEMPALFELEALKAQAVAARTYALYHSFYSNAETPENIGQAYLPIDERIKKWGGEFDVYEEKIQQAVLETENEVLVYGGDIINAVFHSMSAGVTESGENAWQFPVDYLQSVESGFETRLDGFISEKFIAVPELLGICSNAREGFIFDPPSITVKGRSDAGYVSNIQIGNQNFTGAEIRSMLGLRSSCFYISADIKGLVFIVKGYGHGVGMSQFGANEMAKTGAGYREILLYYYSGTTLSIIE